MLRRYKSYYYYYYLSRSLFRLYKVWHIVLIYCWSSTAADSTY